MPFFPTTQEDENNIVIAARYFADLETSRIKPGPPGEQVSALSITPWPLGQKM